jgi:hypothetical protein
VRCGIRAWIGALLLLTATACKRPPPPWTHPLPWSPATPSRVSGGPGVRGVTIGPIENALHPGVGYGSSAYARELDECVRFGATWVAITPFGRVADLGGTGVDPTFETPYELNFPRVLTAIGMAHARGLKVFLVPHLWVESGGWRALIDPGTDAGWARWAASYERFVLGWARIAEAGQAEMFSAGVELRSWVTTARAPSFVDVIHAIRGEYHGTLTYSANWDDVDRTVILGELDVIGINAFYPLADHDAATPEELRAGGEAVRGKVHALSEAWHRPVLFTEVGYTTRPDPAVKPWEWPDGMHDVKVDEEAQAEAYAGLVAPLLDEPDFAGFFVWRVYSDPDDVSQEAEWGFSPKGKLAELVVRDAFAARWVGEERGWGGRARVVGVAP